MTLPSILLAPTQVTDFSRFYQATVDRIEYPRTITELHQLVTTSKKPIALAGGKYSMGGQVWCQDGLVIDTAQLNAITAFDPEKKVVTVQAGIRWRDVQEFLLRHGLAVQVMQSYNDFSVGGFLAVNVHGRDP